MLSFEPPGAEPATVLATVPGGAVAAAEVVVVVVCIRDSQSRSGRHFWSQALKEYAAECGALQIGEVP